MPNVQKRIYYFSDYKILNSVEAFGNSLRQRWKQKYNSSMLTSLSKDSSDNNFLKDEQIKASFSVANGLRPLTYIIIFLTMVLQINSQCCVTFEDNQCIQCPEGTHLFRGSCLFDKPNCQQYAHGFDCVACKEGFVIDVNGNCLATSQVLPPIPGTGFEDVDVEEYQTMLIQNVIMAVQQSFNNLGPMTVFKIYQINTTANYLYTNPTTIGTQLDPSKIIYNKFYRLVFIIDSGLVEVVVLYQPNLTKPVGTLADQSLTLANYKLYQKYPYQIFIDLLSDPYSNEIRAEMQRLYPYYLNDTIVDAFKSIDIGTRQNQTTVAYRIFITNPNEGLVQLKIDISMTPQQVHIQDVNASSDLYDIIKQIVNSNNFSQYFLSGEMGEVQKIEKNNISVYNVTYSFPNLKMPSGNLLQVYFIFQIDNSTNRVIVREMHLQNLINYNKTMGGELSWGQFCFNNRTSYIDISVRDNRKPLIASKLFNITFKNFTLPTTPTPTNNTIDLQLIFMQQISINKFLRTSAYDGIRRYLLKQYSEVVGADLIRVSYAANDTEEFYEMVYLAYSSIHPMIHFMFAIHLNNDTIELVSTFKTDKNTQQKITVDVRNRASLLASLPIVERALIDRFIPRNVFYESAAELSQIQRFNYTDQAGFHNRVQLKYYYPPELALTFEYVVFRFVIDSSIHVLNTVVLPIEQFVPLNNNSEVMLAETLIYYAMFNLAISNQFPEQTVLNITKSLDRQGRETVFRLIISYLYYNQTLLWEIDINQNQQQRIITNLTEKLMNIQSNSQSINTTNPLINNSNTDSLNVSTIAWFQGNAGHKNSKNNVNASEGNITVLPTLQLFNVTELVSNFPTVTTTKNKVSTEMSAYSVDQLLSMMQIRLSIAKFFNTTVNAIRNVKVISVQTILNIIDTYTVRFQVGMDVPGNLKGSDMRQLSQVKQFTFDVARRCNGFPQISANSWAFSTWLKTNPNFNNSSSADPNEQVKISTVTTSNEQNSSIQIMPSTNMKPLELLSQIFNRSFTLKQPDPPRTSSYNVSSVSQGMSRNFITFPFIAANANAMRNSVLLNSTLKLFVQNLGQIKPVRYIENITFNPAGLELIAMPDCIDAQLVTLLSSLINNTNIYQPQLCNITNISMVKNDKTLYMVLLQHIYYGTIRLWLALPSYLPSPHNKLLSVEYLSSNIFQTNDTSILRQVETLANVESILSRNVSAITKSYKYDKSIGIDNITYWTYNKINCIEQLQLYYQMEGFVVKVGAIISKTVDKGESKLDIYLREKSIRKNDRDITIGRAGESECVQVNTQNSQCLKCNKGYYVDQKDGKCYKRIDNCYVQSRQLCIACQNGFVVDKDYKCL